MTSQLLFGPGSLTLAQVVSFSLVAGVFLVIIAVNVTVFYFYRRAKTEDERQAVKVQRKKMSDVWVYHVHRPSTKDRSRGGGDQTESPSEQILRKLKASHENMRASLASAESSQAQEGTLGQEESQAIEELEVLNDLFMHDDSCHSSRRSSVNGSDNNRGSLRVSDQKHKYSGFMDHAATPSGLGFSDHDSISLSSVKMSDFENDPSDVMGLRRSKKKKNKRGRRGGGGEAAGGVGGGEDPPLPVAEFHNEAFEFVESTTAVERVKDVEL